MFFVYEKLCKKVQGCCHCMISGDIGVVFALRCMYWREFLHIDSPAFTPPITSLGISFFSAFNQSQKVGRVQSFFTFMYLSITPHHTLCTIHTSTLMYSTYIKALSRDFSMRTVMNVHWSNVPTHIHVLYM
jgi:hypothetical protein